MDKYQIIQQIGDGTYGTVAKALHRKTNQLVAIKRMKQKYFTWDECIRLPEVQALRKLHTHPNIIKLREVLRENNELFFVFEFMDGDLLGVIRKAKQSPPANPAAPFLSHARVRAIMYQVFQALAHVHKCGYFHRDMKPENLLIRRDPAQSTAHEIVKLADFGLVKEVRARQPYTDYVSTRWYRAPELLLQDRAYSCPVDMWAAGCIMAELMSTRPLFPGNNELDQLFRIICVFGPPTEATWPEGCAMARKLRYTFPNPATTPLRKVLPQHVPAAAYDLLEKLLVYDPRKRLTAQQALQHAYFTTGGAGLDGPLAFEQPLSTVGVPRPNVTSSAPPSQLHPVPGPRPAPDMSTKPGSADRPMMPPINISKPSNHMPALNSSLGAGTTSGYGSQYAPAPQPQPSMQPQMQVGVPLGPGGAPLPVPYYRRDSQTTAAADAAMQRPPTKVDTPKAVTSLSSAALGLTGGGSRARNSLLGTPVSSIAAQGGSTKLAAAMNNVTAAVRRDEELDALLAEFTKGLGGHSGDKPDSSMRPLMPLGSNAASGSPAPGGQLRGTTMTPVRTVGQGAAGGNGGVTEESPLQKLLNSARHRNGTGSAINTPGGSFASRKVPTPRRGVLNGPQKVIGTDTTITPNIGSIIRDENTPAWL